MRSPHYRLALLCLVTATFFTSTAGVLLRWLEEAEGWRVLFWRSLFFALTMALWLALVHRGSLRRAFTQLSWRGLELALVWSAATVAFIFALLETTVARVVIINALLPFVTAILGWLVLGERVRPLTWLAMALATVGIAVMAQGGIAAGGSLLGDLLSALCCLLSGMMFVSMRRHPEVDKVPAMFVAGLLIMPVALAMAPEIAVSPHDLAILAALGCLQLGAQYLLVSYASRAVPAAEIALTGRLGIVLAPLWAWLGAGEIPAEATLWGGAIVLAAVAGQGIFGLRRRPQAVARALDASTAAGPAA
jgi:drug/metabolite transporter (DMT)-like permease